CNALGIIICLITDLTAKVQFEKIKFLKIDNYINFIVSSEEAGVDKPGVAIFKLALEKIRLLPEQVMMIGDSYERDIAGAKKLGLKTFLVEVVNI
ncbi:MAG: HAD family hydrolase, partial [Patescibacteria group bacterium]